MIKSFTLYIMNCNKFMKEYIKFNPVFVLQIYSRSTEKPIEVMDGSLS